MILSVSYDELSSLVREVSGQPLGLQYKDVDTLTVSYDATISLPIINKPITHTLSADVRLVELDLPRVVLQLDAGKAGNMALDLASKKLLSKLPEGLVTEFSDGRAVLDLSAVPKLASLFDFLKVHGLSFYDSSLSLDAELTPPAAQPAEAEN